MPWGNIPQYRRTTFVAPELPRGGLLGGSGAPPKMSKLQALAAARKKKGEDKKSEEKVKETEQKMKTLSVEETSLQKENRKPTLGGLSKRRKIEGDSVYTTEPPGEQLLPVVKTTHSDKSQPPAEPEPVTDEMVVDIEPAPEPARPSAFAQALLGSASAAPKVQLQSFPPPYMAYNVALADAFAKPSPDDVVLAAQAQGSRFGNGKK